MAEFTPYNESQQRFLLCEDRSIMYSSGVGGGKSLTGCWKGFKFNLEYPGARGLIVRAEKSAAVDSTKITLMEDVLPEQYIVYHNKSKQIIKHLTTEAGVTSTIIIRGIDRKEGQDYSQRLGSTEYSWIFVDEGIELREEEWTFLKTRLRYRTEKMKREGKQTQIWTTTNPDSSTHWLYKKFIEEDNEDHSVFYTTPLDNPHLSDEYKEDLKTMTGYQKDRLLHGRWVKSSGTIYEISPDQYQDSEGFLEPSEYKELRVGMDSNYPLPRAAVIIGMRGGGQPPDILEEYYVEESHPEDLGEWLKQWMEKHGVSKGQVYPVHDPSDPSAIDKIEQETGLTVYKADNAVVSGISTVQRYITRGMRIHPRCKHLVDELNKYVWKKEGDKPDKTDDHLMDSLRYALHTDNQVQFVELEL